MENEMREIIERLQQRIEKLEMRESMLSKLMQRLATLLARIRSSRRAVLGAVVLAAFCGTAIYVYAASIVTVVPHPPVAGNAIAAADLQSNFGALLNNDSSLNGDLAKLDSSHWSAVTGGISYSGGKIGIGTTSPYALLQIYGDSNMLVLSSDKTSQDYRIGISSSDNSFDIDDATANARRITIQRSTGYVGIGTTTPSATMDVEGGFHMQRSGSTVVSLTPNSWNTITHNMNSGSLIIFAMNGDGGANNFTITSVSRISGNQFQFYASGGAAGAARIDWVIFD